MVPRHEYEDMKRKVSEEKAVAKSLENERMRLEDHISNLNVLTEKFETEVSSIKQKLSSITPHPSWEEFVENGVTNWGRLIAEKLPDEVFVPETVDAGLDDETEDEGEDDMFN